jgi:hypothetical protein
MRGQSALLSKLIAASLVGSLFFLGAVSASGPCGSYAQAEAAVRSRCPNPRIQNIVR